MSTRGKNLESAGVKAGKRPDSSAVAHEHHDHHGTGRSPLLALALGSLGVVYGDIGTSPLYALRECFSGPHGIAPTPENIMGVLSLIFWSLIIVITIKYIVFIMRADNDGEGGILALTALATPVRRLARIRRRWLVLLGVFGAALLYGDGVITPAISVLSAVEGLKVATPALSPYVLPITITIIVGLFAIQSHGTATIGRLFGPVMLVWFSVLGLLGVINITRDVSVLGALSPHHAIAFFGHSGWHGFLVLGTVFLAVTGGEALYADMGHFGARPIRLAWFTVALPALLLNYMGQGALLLHEPHAAENSFYLMAPGWALYPLVVLATLATIIASQALISGVYSITMQAEHLGFMPRLNIIHTSPTAHGQIYIPFMNWLLMGACIVVVLGFRSSSALAAAYGVAVTSTMAITTIIFAIVARERWRWSLPRVALLCGAFLIVDSAFLVANLLKVPQGGWFPLVIAALLYILMTTWKRGSELVFTLEQHWEQPIKDLLERIRQQPPTRAPGTAIFLSARPAGAPAALLANLKYNNTLHERVLLASVHTEGVPYIHNEAERVKLQPLGEGIYVAIVHYGFMEKPDVPTALANLAEPDRIVDLDSAPYFVNRTRVIPTKLPGMALWRERIYSFLRHNSATATDFFCLPPTRVFEISTRIEM